MDEYLKKTVVKYVSSHDVGKSNNYERLLIIIIYEPLLTTK